MAMIEKYQLEVRDLERKITQQQTKLSGTGLHLFDLIVHVRALCMRDQLTSGLHTRTELRHVTTKLLHVITKLRHVGNTCTHSILCLLFDCASSCVLHEGQMAFTHEWSCVT